MVHQKGSVLELTFLLVSLYGNSGNTKVVFWLKAKLKKNDIKIVGKGGMTPQGEKSISLIPPQKLRSFVVK